MKGNRLYLAMAVDDPGIKHEMEELVEMSSSQFNGLSDYLNYEQQKKTMFPSR